MQQTVYKLSIGNTLSRYSCAGTEFLSKMYGLSGASGMCHKFNASVMQNMTMQ